MMSGTIPVRSGEEFNVEAVREIIRANFNDVPDEPMEVEQFPSGASNLTYLVRIGNWEAVLRRPPFGPLPPKAHDMKREFDFLRLLHPVFPLAPEPYLFCDDESVIGAPFYLMERRKGIVIDKAFPPGLEVTVERCWHISEKMVDALVELHSVDVFATGLHRFGRPEGFIKRQVEGWIDRYHRARTDEIPVVERLTKWLMDHIPISQEATIIHNDFKLNNVLFSDELDRPVAVVDWEMSTIADPLFDLGVSLGYWLQDDDPEPLKRAVGSMCPMPGFLTREEFVQRYAGLSGRDIRNIHFYLTFAYFKHAVIVQQIYYRWKKGQTKDERFAANGERVKTLMEHAYLLSQRKAGGIF